jgi:hypothetical protein
MNQQLRHCLQNHQLVQGSSDENDDGADVVSVIDAYVFPRLHFRDRVVQGSSDEMSDGGADAVSVIDAYVFPRLHFRDRVPE